MSNLFLIKLLLLSFVRAALSASRKNIRLTQERERNNELLQSSSTSRPTSFPRNKDHLLQNKDLNDCILTYECTCNVTRFELSKTIINILSPSFSLESIMLGVTKSPQKASLCWLIMKYSNQNEFAGDELSNNITLLSSERVIQQYVLGVFYFSLQGWKWERSFNFMSYDTQECSWNEYHGWGIFCNDESFVKDIYLDYNNMHGSIPSEICSLAYLEVLNLEQNNIHGRMPECLGGLTHLEYLSLDNNGLEGHIPRSIAELGNLYWLNLGNNELRGDIPTNIGNLSQLKWLGLFSNHLTSSIPESIGKLSRLGDLNIANNNLNGTIPESLGNLTNLERLNVQNNRFTGTIPSSLSSLQNLVDLFSSKYNQTESSYANLNLIDPLPCETSELIIDLKNEEKQSTSFQLFYGNERLILETGKKAKTRSSSMIFSICISPTGCYSLLTNTTNTTVKVDDKYLHLSFDSGRFSADTGGSYYNFIAKFGFSASLDKHMTNQCDSVAICSLQLNQGDEKRILFDNITEFVSLKTLNDKASLVNKALCWWLNDVESQKRYRSAVSSDDFLTLTQRFILSLLYYSTNGNDWHKNTHWLTNENECEWHGIDCAEKGSSLKVINLTSNNLQGYLPNEIGYLARLNEIILNSNGIIGNLPSDLARLPTVQRISIADNNLRGSLASELSCLYHLIELDLSANLFTNTIPYAISLMSTITNLDLSNNWFSGPLPTEIQRMNVLKILNVSSNLLEGETSFLAQIESIERLDISDNYFSGSLPIQGEKQSSLKVLRAHGNDFGGVVPSSIGDMIYIEELLLHDNNIRGTLPTETGKLKNLLCLTLNHNQLKGEIPSELRSLQMLEMIHLHSNDLYGKAAEIESVSSYITDCVEDTAGDNFVTCETCTVCCGIDGECTDEIVFWPYDVLKNISNTSNASFEMCIFIFTLAASLVVLLASIFIFLFRAKLPKLRRNRMKKFYSESVYRLFLGRSKTGWLLALLTAVLQFWITYVFVQASYNTNIHDRDFSFTCPAESLDCKNNMIVDWVGWLTYVLILLIFVLPNIIDGIFLFYGSSIRGQICGKGFFSSLLLLSLSAFVIYSSVVYLYATSATNTGLVKDTIVILMLHELDSYTFKLVLRLAPIWLDKTQFEIENFRESLVLTVSCAVETQDLSVVDITNHGSSSLADTADITQESNGHVEQQSNNEITTNQKNQIEKLQEDYAKMVINMNELKQELENIKSFLSSENL